MAGGEQGDIPYGDGYYEIQWEDPLHVWTNRFGAMPLDDEHPEWSPDFHWGGSLISQVELFLTGAVAHIDHFHGIIRIDVLGVWFHDADQEQGHEPFRQYLIPWHMIQSMVMYRST